ncbi:MULTISPECIES: hypothetical protein [unclassified Burkholderia]|uniref:hypothetical protein n=1 Tax=unclassified Burkholderia TaxID=2613784 RepID=UPI002AAFF468|nr:MULTISPECIES: hypothetical protein [unclassified Burkholderia]
MAAASAGRSVFSALLNPAGADADEPRAPAAPVVLAVDGPHVAAQRDQRASESAGRLEGEVAVRASTEGDVDRIDATDPAVTHVVRSLSRLVAAVAYRPGSQADPGAKRATLERLVLGAQAFAQALTARSVSSATSAMQAQAQTEWQELAAGLLARQWEAGGEAEVDPLVDSANALVDAIVEGRVGRVGRVTAVAGGDARASAASVVDVADVTEAPGRFLVVAARVAFSLAEALAQAGLRGAPAAAAAGRLTNAALDEVLMSSLTSRVPEALREQHIRDMLSSVAALLSAEIHAAADQGERAVAGETTGNTISEAAWAARLDVCWAHASQGYQQIEALAVAAYERVLSREEHHEKMA